MELKGREYSPVPFTRCSANKTFGPTGLTSTDSVCIWWHRASNPDLSVGSPMLHRYLCHDEFRGPRSDYVRQAALATTA
ncbi:hypothetical protein TNCV_3283651 [Trichonephila clavipes]|nr:hypothetical protein TNCV_3283651 [Trichonephila clavipes]